MDVLSNRACGRFVARRPEGESMTDLCREFRYLPQDRIQDLRPLQGSGLEALSDRSRRANRYTNQLSQRPRAAIVQASDLTPM